MPTPSRVLAALVPDPVTLPDGTSLHPVTMGTYLLLEKVNCALAKDGAVPTARDIAAAVFILAHPPAETRKLLAKSLAAFEDAVAAFADNIPAADLPGIGRALTTHLGAAVATAAPSSGGGDADSAGSQKKTQDSAGS